MKSRAIAYLPDELAWLAANAHLPRREIYDIYVRRFGRDDVSFSAFKGMCKRKGFMTGRSGRFVAGQAGIPGSGKRPADHPNSVQTRFQNGSRPANQTPRGTERTTIDGYIEIAVAETNPYTGHPRRYVMKQHHLWQQLHGPLPKDHCLKCLDGDRTNCDPSNWEAIPRAMLPRLNGISGRDYDQAPAEIKPVIMAITKLEHAARMARKGPA